MILSGEARLAGVMGWPVSHSRSPRLHGFWLDRHGIDGAYVPLAVEPAHLEQALRALPVVGFRGVNLTVPHKEDAVRLVDELELEARRIGAVNTVYVRADGTLVGDNTDGYGFMESLGTSAPHWEPEVGPAVVVGAGGAARAVVCALVDAGVPELRLVNRTLERAEALAVDAGGPVRVVPWKDRSAAVDGAMLLVNTTTQGMSGRPALDIVLDDLPAHAVVADIVYTPLVTPLLATARKRGNATVDGLGMLLHQARPGFAAWFGVEPEADEDVRRFVAHDLMDGQRW